MKAKVSILMMAVIVSTNLFSSKKGNDFSMTFQQRQRAEYRNGVLQPRNASDDATGFINSRSRLSILYQSSDITMSLSAQNTGVWGMEPQVSHNPNLGLYEAWAQLNLNDGLFLKLGRQQLAYDDERILGALDWNTAGRSHDLLKTGFETNNHKLHLLLAYNQNREKVIGGTYYATTAQPYKTMQTLWYQYAGTTNFKPSFIMMNLGLENGNSLTGKSELVYLQTLGSHIASRPSKKMGMDLSAYYQMGTTKTNQEINAWMIAIKSSFALNKQSTLILGTDILSGQDNNNSNNTYTAFNPLYGTHHKFYGAMDYFYATSFAGGLNPGLWDSYAGISIKGSNNVNFSSHLHYFAITADIQSNSGILSKTLGVELDLQLDWKVRDNVQLSCGYSTLKGSSSMDVVKGGNHKAWQDWGWISLNINPRILHVKF
jgi:hypothetical protein